MQAFIPMNAFIVSESDTAFSCWLDKKVNEKFMGVFSNNIPYSLTFYFGNTTYSKTCTLHCIYYIHTFVLDSAIYYSSMTKNNVYRECLEKEIGVSMKNISIFSSSSTHLLWKYKFFWRSYKTCVPGHRKGFAVLCWKHTCLNPLLF